MWLDLMCACPLYFLLLLLRLSECWIVRKKAHNLALTFYADFVHIFSPPLSSNAGAKCLFKYHTNRHEPHIQTQPSKQAKWHTCTHVAMPLLLYILHGSSGVSLTLDSFERTVWPPRSCIRNETLVDGWLSAIGCCNMDTSAGAIWFIIFQFNHAQPMCVQLMWRQFYLV